MLQMLFRMAYLELYSLMFNTGKHILKGYNIMFYKQINVFDKKKKKEEERKSTDK